MNVVDRLAPVSQPMKLASAVLASWRRITRQQIAATFLLGCALHVYRMVVSINILYAPYIFVGDQLKAFILLLAFVAADAVTGKDPDRRGTYALAVLIGTAIAQPLAGLTIWVLIMLFVDASLRPPGGIGFFLNPFFELLMVGGATVWVINDRRRARGERDRMHAAELERIAAERGSIESDLQAMQARVEPLFLFNTLAQVKRLYANDAALGGQVLDALIAYLRAAMPQLRDTSSTVGQELDLVRAYLDIAQLCSGQRLTFAIEPIDAKIAAARIPPMMLLPLVDRSIANVVTDSRVVGSIRIRGALAIEKIRFEITETGGEHARGAEDDRVVAIRKRLTMLHGNEARLVIRRLSAGESQAILEIPHQRSPLAVDEWSAFAQA